MASAWEGKAGDNCIAVLMRRRKNGDPLRRQAAVNRLDWSFLFYSTDGCIHRVVSLVTIHTTNL